MPSHLDRIRNRLHGGIRIGRLIIWTGWRSGPHDHLRWEWTGRCLTWVINFRPTIHSDLNFMFSLRLR